MKRIKIKPNKPNPLFEFWLEEWMKEAASRKSELQQHFSKALSSLKKYPLPLKSGKDCIILQHFGIKLCSMLDKKLEEYKNQNNDSTNFSDYVCINCKHDDQNSASKRKYSKHYQTQTESVQPSTELSIFHGIDILSWGLENYAVLLILYEKVQNSCYPSLISEVDLLIEARALCSSTSKSSISCLFDNGLVSMTGSPIRYSLTEHGLTIAKEIFNMTVMDSRFIKSPSILKEIKGWMYSMRKKISTPVKGSTHFNDEDINAGTPITDALATKSCPNLNIDPNSDQIMQSKAIEISGFRSGKSDDCHGKKNSKENTIEKQNEQEMLKKLKKVKSSTIHKAASKKADTIENCQKGVCLESNKFDVVLLVDTQETCGGKTKPQHDATIAELTQLDVLFEVRHLKVGDFAWIARCKNTSNELILPHIIERKRIDDLSASITDGRFHEQKFRLKQSGIENLMYIIEEHDKNHRSAIPHASLMQASINSLIQDGFTLKYTKSHKDSMFYLSSLTRILNQIYKGKNLIGCKKENLIRTDILSGSVTLMEFGEFNKAASKQKAFKVNQMFVRQLLQLKGMSVDKAIAIVERYPTPRILVDSLHKSDSNTELLLANIQFGDKKRMVGQAISKTVYQLYTKKSIS